MIEPVIELPIILGGVLGSIVKIILENDGKFLIPSYYTVVIDGVKRSFFSMGFLGNVLTGIITAVFIDHSFFVSFLGAVLGTWFIERAYDFLRRIREGKLEVIK